MAHQRAGLPLPALLSGPRAIVLLAHHLPLPGCQRTTGRSRQTFTLLYEAAMQSGPQPRYLKAPWQEEPGKSPNLVPELLKISVATEDH